jgi:hypothetical protein
MDFLMDSVSNTYQDQAREDGNQTTDRHGDLAWRLTKLWKARADEGVQKDEESA